MEGRMREVIIAWLDITRPFLPGPEKNIPSEMIIRHPPVAPSWSQRRSCEENTGMKPAKAGYGRQAIECRPPRHRCTYRRSPCLSITCDSRPDRHRCIAPGHSFLSTPPLRYPSNPG